jgi:hypothetical protein
VVREVLARSACGPAQGRRGSAPTEGSRPTYVVPVASAWHQPDIDVPAGSGHRARTRGCPVLHVAAASTVGPGDAAGTVRAGRDRGRAHCCFCIAGCGCRGPGCSARARQPRHAHGDNRSRVAVTAELARSDGAGRTGNLGRESAGPDGARAGGRIGRGHGDKNQEFHPLPPLDCDP